MSNQQLYNTHRANGVPHDEAAAALGVSNDQARMLKSRYNKANGPTEAAQPSPPKVRKPQPEQRPGALDFGKRETVATTRNYRGVALDALLIGIVIGHAGLIWYDCGVQWQTPGIIGGGLAFAIILAALILASDSTKSRTSEAALYFVLLVDGAAWWVHYPTFQQYAGIGNTETGMFAGFLCLCSWFALFLFRDSKID